jgi:hypothetical protein
VVNSQHDGKLLGLPSLKDNEKQHECRKCKRGAMIETTHVVRMLPGCSTA